MKKKFGKGSSQQDYEQFIETFEEAFLPKLQEYFDGFVLVGYRADDRQKFAYLDGSDPASRDALHFFRPAVAAWWGLEEEGEEEEEESSFV